MFARVVERRPSSGNKCGSHGRPSNDERGVDHAGSRSPAVPTSLGEPKTLAGAEVVQMLFLLQAAWGAVTSTGARMRVLTSA